MVRGPSELYCDAQPLGWGTTTAAASPPRATPSGSPNSPTQLGGALRQTTSPSGAASAPPQPPTLTPWYPTGVPNDGVCLEDELLSFDKLQTLTPEEEEARKEVAVALQRIVRPYWSNARVQIYGSLAYGLSNPESAIDIVVEDCGDPAPFEDMLQAASQEGFQISGAFLGDAEWYAKLFAPCGVVVCVSFIRGRSRALQVVSTIRKLGELYPSVAPAYSVVRTLLRQSKCGDAVTGGLPSYAALLMLFKLVRRGPAPGSPDGLLTDFLNTFGGDGPMPIVGGPGQEAPEGWDPRQLWVTDPLDSSNNVAAGCAKLLQVRSVFRHCACSLEKWAEQQAYSPHRRRTALSSVIAMRALWPRAGGQPPAPAQAPPQPPLLTGSPNAPHASHAVPQTGCPSPPISAAQQPPTDFSSPPSTAFSAPATPLMGGQPMPAGAAPVADAYSTPPVEYSSPPTPPVAAPVPTAALPPHFTAAPPPVAQPRRRRGGRGAAERDAGVPGSDVRAWPACP